MKKHWMYRRSAERCDRNRTGPVIPSSRPARRWVMACLAVMLMTSAAQALVVPPPQQPIFDKDVPARLPDLDQNRDYTGDQIPETTWCAPTAAANSVWYFGQSGYPELIPAATINPSKYYEDGEVARLAGRGCRRAGPRQPPSVSIASSAAKAEPRSQRQPVPARPSPRDLPSRRCIRSSLGGRKASVHHPLPLFQ